MTKPAADNRHSSNRGRERSAAYSTPYVAYAVGLLFLVNVLSYVDRQALSILAPLIKRDLSLSDSELGLLTGLAFALFYAICGVPIARLADTGSRRNILACALAIWSVMTAICGLAHNFLHLFLARVGVGAGEAGGHPTAYSILCDYVGPVHRVAVLSIHTFGGTVGMVVGLALAGYLGESLGWRWAFALVGLPGVGVAAVVWFSLREPDRGRHDIRSDLEAEFSVRATIHYLWKCRLYRIYIAFNVVLALSINSTLQWWPSFMLRTFTLPLSTVGARLGIAIGISSGLALLASSVFAATVARRDLGLPLRLGALSSMISAPLILGALFSKDSTTSMGLLSAAIFFATLPAIPFVAAMMTTLPPQIRATGTSINTLFLSAIGFGLGPLLVGLASDLLTPSLDERALGYALLIPVALLPVLAGLSYVAGNALRRTP